MKTLSHKLIIFFFLLLALAQAHASAPKTILVFGDSLSAAYGLDERVGWPYLLQQRLKTEKLNWNIINLSISGETSSGGLQRFAKAFAKHKPELVFLELGANDGLRGQSLKSMRNNLQKIITQSKDHHAEVIIAGMHIPSNYGKRYTQAFHNVFIELSESNDVVLIPFLLDGVVENDNLLLPDRIHPNAEGQKIVLRNVWKYLKPLL